MRIVVTGATSFIGTAVVKQLLEQRHEVYAVVRPGSSNLGHLLEATRLSENPRELKKENDIKQTIVSTNMKIIELDLHRIEDLQIIADVWMHIGWDGAGSENRKNRDVQQRNVAQSLAAVRAAAAAGCRRFIFTGSQAEYGLKHDWIHEDSECLPVSEYGKAKVDFSVAAKQLCKLLRMEYIHTRIFSIYGPGDHPWSLVNTCIQTWRQGGTMQFGACTQQWNYLYIEDVADALCHFLTEGNSGFYNLASKDTRPLRSYIEEMYRLCGRCGTYMYGTRPQNAEGSVDLMPDIEKILGDTTWRPRTSFTDGVSCLLNDYSANALNHLSGF